MCAVLRGLQEILCSTLAGVLDVEATCSVFSRGAVAMALLENLGQQVWGVLVLPHNRVRARRLGGFYTGQNQTEPFVSAPRRDERSFRKCDRGHLRVAVSHDSHFFSDRVEQAGRCCC